MISHCFYQRVVLILASFGQVNLEIICLQVGVPYHFAAQIYEGPHEIQTFLIDSLKSSLNLNPVENIRNSINNLSGQDQAT